MKSIQIAEKALKNLVAPPLPIIRMKEVHFQYSIRQKNDRL